MANSTATLLVILMGRCVLRFNSVIANAAGYAVGLTLSYFLNKDWTFRFRGDNAASVLRFLVVFFPAYLVNVITMLTLIKITGIDSFWSQLVGMAAYSTTFYLGCRCYAFSECAREKQRFWPWGSSGSRG